MVQKQRYVGQSHQTPGHDNRNTNHAFSFPVHKSVALFGITVNDRLCFDEHFSNIAFHTPKLKSNSMILWKEFLVLKEKASLLQIIFAPSGSFCTNDRTSAWYTYFSCSVLCLAVDFLINNIYVRFGSSVFRQVIGIPMGTNSAPLLADLFLHTFEYDSMVKTMKQDITKAIQFSNVFRYIDDLFSINNVDFRNYIIAI